MSEILPLNLADDQRAKRSLLKCYVDIGKQTGEWDAASAEWEPLGVGTEDASIEKDYDDETTKDIWDITRTSVNTVTKTISFDPNTVRGGDKLVAILSDIDRREAWDELSNFPILTVREYFGTTEAFDADVFAKCTIRDTGVGGSAYVDMPLDITFGGDRVLGKVSYTGKTPIFTPDT